MDADTKIKAGWITFAAAVVFTILIFGVMDPDQDAVDKCEDELDENGESTSRCQDVLDDDEMENFSDKNVIEHTSIEGLGNHLEDAGIIGDVSTAVTFDSGEE